MVSKQSGSGHCCPSRTVEQYIIAINKPPLPDPIKKIFPINSLQIYIVKIRTNKQHNNPLENSDEEIEDEDNPFLNKKEEKQDKAAPYKSPGWICTEERLHMQLVHIK